MVTMIRSDLDFILAQIKIAEADAAGKDLIAEGILPNSEVPWGLRRVDGSNNNLTPGQGSYGAAGQPFPRETPPSYTEGSGGLAFGPAFTDTGLPTGTKIDFGFPDVPPGFIPLSAAGQTTSPNGTSLVGLQPNYFNQNQYGVPLPNNNPDPRGFQPGDVADADPRVISNLIVDQTVNNPAALFKALQDAGLTNTAAFNLLPQIDLAVQFLKLARGGNNAGLEQLAEDNLRNLLDLRGVTLEEAPTGDILKATLYIGNVAADEGLSAPFNGWMTMFGQFFDHGLDLVAKGGFGTVYIPLQPDDPLYDHSPGARTNFMVITRATLGDDGQPVNLVTPFVDQNQTYTSHASHQVFLREYDREGILTEATGRLLDGNAKSGGGLATWADVKAHAIEMLGIKLSNHDIHSVPLLSTDQYGKFIPGPNGYAQVVVEVTQNVLNDQGQPVSVKSNVLIEGRAGGLDIHALTVADLPESFADADVTSISIVPTGVAFLDDIAHTANPGAGEVADGDVATPADGNVPADDAVGLSDASGAPVSNTGFYDDELLDAHYITGDGRGNENIGLTAVHHVFHAEHNRQVDLIQDLLVTEGDIAFLREWLNNDIDQTTIDEINELSGTERTDAIKALDWNGDRIFQAAKFPTEMQYQHLVFEEFARKVQPAVNVFNDYDGTLDPAILAEFAHTVYRFGHSMLTETVDRYTSDWQTVGSGGEVGEAQIGLIEAFLNPLEFAASGVSAEQAAGVIAQGMTRQRGSEIDEFVTEALRNNLVGLPLDLAAINIARGRETGVPTLNEAREDFFSKSGDTQIKPYESWYEFMQNLKNPASLINFIAAYGNHESITSVVGYEAKREAATDLVLGGGAVSEEDRLDFLNGRSGHPDRGGLDTVDFWIGGLAEKKLIFGGMLGSTFNFVFEAQLEALQNADRFYYLSRLANLNLTAQLENNKFSEMIHRNTTATHLPGDAFARPDFFLEADIRKQFNADLGVGIDPTTEQVEIDPYLNGASGGGNNGLVLRTDVDGDFIAERLEYTGAEHVVLGGTEGDDWLIGGKGDDTLWGDGGDDRLEGGDGNDFIFGGDGNDIITDLFGVDEIRSGAGDDVVSAGRGLKLIITDTGNDWVWGGVDDDEVLAGQGNDFVNGGDGADFLIGGEGNDWLESGRENGLMLGDNGDLVQGLPIKRSVDSRIVGHDVMLATGGNADFDAETGDDIMVGGLGTDRFFGQFGFDWATYKFDNFGIEADMNNRLFSPPLLPASPGAILDRYAQTEGLSGSKRSDILRGDDVADLAGGGEGAIVDGLDHALYDENVSLIIGLDILLAGIDEGGALDPIRFSGGNILLGGDASDIIEGRGGNDIIDGDAWLDVHIRHISGETHETMAGFQQRVLAGSIPVSELSIVREIKGLDGGPTIDIAEYSGLRAEYLISDEGDGFVTVTHLVLDAGGNAVAGQIGADGVDKLKNIERLLFSDQTIKITEHANSIATGVPQIEEVNGTLFATLPATTATDADGVADPIVFYWQVELVPGSGVFTNINKIVADEFAPVTGPSFTPTAAEAGLTIRVLARFKDNAGVFETVVSAPIIPVGGIGAIVIPDPAVELGLDLAGVDVDGAPLADGTIGILEDSGVFTFTEDDLLAGIRAANPGVTLSIAAANGVPTVIVRQIEGAPPASSLTFADGVFTFTPPLNFNGGVTFEFELLPANVPPGVELELGAEATLDVIGVNDAPVAPAVTLPDVPAGPANTVTFTIADLFGNTPIDADGDRIDVDGDRLDIDPDLVTASVGTLAFDGTDTFTLTIPAGTPVGAVGISYQIDDGLVTVPVTATLALTNSLPTGQVVLNDVGPTEGQPLSLNTTALVDANGSTGPFSVQWQTAIASLDGTPGAFQNVAGATGATFTPAQAHVNRFVQAIVTYTDGGGTVEQVVSAPSVRVIGDLITGTGANSTHNGTAGDDTINGMGGVDTLNGLEGDDQLAGGTGNDSVNGGAGDDTITWNSSPFGLTPDGRDIVNGGTEDIAGDTFTVNGSLFGETFRIYTRDEFVLANPAAVLAAGTEIVLTRNGTAVGNIIAELQEIEEIIINGDNRTDVGGNQPQPGTVGGDTIQVFGDFTNTSLRLNTITIQGTSGADTIDISALTSAHRIVFRSNGGNDTIVGNLRPQDVIEIPANQNLSTYKLQDAGNGMMTFTNGSHSVTFTGSVPPQFQNAPGGPAGGLDDEDLESLLDLVRDGPARDSSGLGNNAANPTWGAAGHQFIRLTEAHFTDGAAAPRETPLTPREISDILSNQDNNGNGQEESIPNAFGGTSLLTFFGQYFDHGLDFVAKGQPGSLPIGSDTFPINAPRSNIVPGTGVDPDGTPNSGDETPAEYINNASPYVDQNQAYGSHNEITNLLRKWVEGPNGQPAQQTAYLLTGELDETGRALLPTLDHVRENYRVMTGGSEITVADISNYKGTGQALLIDFIPAFDQQGQLDLDAIGHYYVTGDGRSNENVMLTSIHTVWARNHNYWVDTLKAKTNGAWTEAEYFEAARMMNIAEYQRVVFTEFATAMAGGLDNDDEHGFTGYDPTIDASISVEFAQAAYRFGHSMLNETVSFVGTNGQLQEMSLVQAFLRPDVVASGGINALLAGAVQVEHQAIDVDVVNALRNQLVGRPLDLAALNIFRGRDMGIAPFNSVREQLYEKTGLPSLRPYTGWGDFQQRNGLSDPLIEKIKLAYGGDFGAIDLWVGGLLEKPQAGQLGSTFGYIFLEQLDRLQNGDRFYYLEIFDDSLFTGANDVTFADIIERTTGLTNLPDNVFDLDQSNAPADDDSIFNEDPEDEEDNDETAGNGNNDNADDCDQGGGDQDDDEDGDVSEVDDDEATEVDEDEDDDDIATGGPASGTGTATSSFVVYLGTAASDTALGAAADDFLSGLDDDDNLFGRSGVDFVSGGDGDDYLDGGEGDDTILGNSGADKIKGGAGHDDIDGGSGNDVIDAGAGNDTITGGLGRDVIKAGTGNDTIVADDNDGNDVIDGGDEAGDSDTLDMSVIAGNITVYLSANGTGTAKIEGGGDADTIKGIENFKGGAGDDVIVASTDVNKLEGGEGEDTFVFNSAAAADGDVVADLDFEQGDTIALSPLFASLALGVTNDSPTLVQGAFTGAGEYRLRIESGDTIVEGNSDDDLTDVEFAIRILGRTDLAERDFS